MKTTNKTVNDLNVTFGNVTVRLAPPSAVAIKANIEAGQKALKRACTAFLHPGITLAKTKGVPYYYGDPDHPDRLIQELDGERTVGRMNSVGRFIPLCPNNSPSSRK